MTSAAEPTLYELLGVSPTASEEEIKSAYRRLMRAAHPDTGGTAGLFRTVQLAYDTLIDPQRRSAYDHSLRTGSPTATYRGSRSGPAGGGRGSSWSAGAGGSGAGSWGSGGSRAGGSGFGGPGADGSGRGSGPGADGSGRETRYTNLYRPMERPPRADAARVGAIFDPPLFPEEDSAGSRRRRGRGPLAFGREKGGREPRAATEILPMTTLRDRTLGQAGTAVDAMGLTSRAAEYRREAARRTAEVVEAAVLPAYPAMRLIHDLRDPGTRNTTIDHAVLVGDHAILIDSVMVDGSSLTLDGAALAPDGVAAGLTLPRILEQSRLWLHPWKVSGVTVLHSSGGMLTEPSIIRVNPDRRPTSNAVGPVEGVMAVLNPLELVEFLRGAAVVEPRTHVVNVRLLRAVLQLRPDARYRG